MPSKQDAVIQSALVFTALADNPDNDIALPSGWTPILVSGYGKHGLTYAVFANTTSKQIAISFGDNINSSVSAPLAVGALANIALQTPSEGPSLGLMQDAASLVLSAFATTQPNYAGAFSLGSISDQSIGPGYTVFVTGAGRGGVAAEYAMEQVLSTYGVAQAGNQISGISFGGAGLSNAGNFQAGVSFTSYTLDSDLFGNSPLVPLHVGTQTPLLPTARDAANAIVDALSNFAPPLVETVIKIASDQFIKQSTVYDYASALAKNGIISTNPLSSLSSSPSVLNFSLNAAIPGLTNYVEVTNPSPLVLETQSGAIEVDGVAQVVTFSYFADGTSNLTLTEDPSGVSAEEVLDYDSAGDQTQNQITIDGTAIDTSGSEDAALTSNVDGDLAVIFSPTGTSAADFELTMDPSGTTELMGVNSTTGDGQEISDFGDNGLSGDSITVGESVLGTVDITLDLSATNPTEVGFDDSPGNIPTSFDFSGVDDILQIGTAGDFIGEIVNFGAGDTIDLAGISAVEATLGPNNVINVVENNGSTLSLPLGGNVPSNEGFAVTPDGTGGSDILVGTPLQYLTVTGRGTLTDYQNSGAYQGVTYSGAVTTTSGVLAITISINGNNWPASPQVVYSGVAISAPILQLVAVTFNGTNITSDFAPPIPDAQVTEYVSYDSNSASPDSVGPTFDNGVGPGTGDGTGYIDEFDIFTNLVQVVSGVVEAKPTDALADNSASVDNISSTGTFTAGLQVLGSAIPSF